MYSLLDIKFYVGKQVTNLVLILSYALPLFWGLHKYNSVVFVLSFTCYSLVLPILYLTCQYMYIYARAEQPQVCLDWVDPPLKCPDRDIFPQKFGTFPTKMSY